MAFTPSPYVEIWGQNWPEAKLCWYRIMDGSPKPHIVQNIQNPVFGTKLTYTCVNKILVFPFIFKV